MKNLGDAINLARRSAGLSQKKLAEILGISYGYVSEIELNKKMPSDELIARISNVLDSPEIMSFATSFRQDYEIVTQEFELRNGKVEVKIDTVPIDLKFLQGAKKYFRVFNSSMVLAGIPVGGIVGFVPVQGFSNGNIMVVRYEGEIMVRGVSHQNGVTYLISASPDHPVIAVTDPYKLEFLGKVVVVISYPDTEYLKQYASKEA